MPWNDVGTRPPRDLQNARLALHHACQLPAIAIAKTLIPARSDDSHTALSWRPDAGQGYAGQANAGQWVTEELPNSDGLRAGLHPTRFTLTLGRGEALDDRNLPLAGATREHALEWLREGIAEEGLDASAVHLAPHYDLPPHPVADQGAPFDTDLGPDLAELATYFANAHTVLTAITLQHGNPGPILTWPHHFDIGGLLPAGPPEARFERTVGIGLSSGDTSYEEPYFYVNVYPAPADAKLPSLPFGHWHTEGFLAAVLTATELLDLPGGKGQHDQVTLFLDTAIAAARALHG